MRLRDRIKAAALPLAMGVGVADVRIGLGYTAVLLHDGGAGMVYTFRDDFKGGCSVYRNIRPLAHTTLLWLLILGSFAVFGITTVKADSLFIGLMVMAVWVVALIVLIMQLANTMPIKAKDLNKDQGSRRKTLRPLTLDQVTAEPGTLNFGPHSQPNGKSADVRRRECGTHGGHRV